MATSDTDRHPLALGIRRTAKSRYVTSLGTGRLSTTRVLLVDGERAVAELPRPYDGRPHVYCPFCGELGKYRHYANATGVSHFAHSHGDDCVAGALETVLHQRAKSVLADGLAQLRKQKRPLLLVLPCLRCNGPAEATVLRANEWDSEAAEVALKSVRLDVAALSGGDVCAGFEVRVTHAVDDGKHDILSESGVPGVELLASALINETTGDVSWSPTRPLPTPVTHWNLERARVPFVICSSCRQLPESARAVAAVASEVASQEMLARLRRGLVMAGEGALKTLDCGGLLKAWQEPEAVPFAVGQKLARSVAAQLVSAETSRLTTLLEEPFAVPWELAKTDKDVPKKELEAAEEAWLALKPSAQARCQTKRRQTYVLGAVASEASRGNTVMRVGVLVNRLRGRLEAAEVAKLGDDLSRLTPRSPFLAGAAGWVGRPALLAAERQVMKLVQSRVQRPPLRTSSTMATTEADRAVGFAFEHRFCVITGGPGTGKTTAVRKLLNRVAHEYAMTSDAKERGRWLLCAPTHKALSRMKQASGAFPFVDFGTVQGAVRMTFERPPVGVLVDEASFLDSSLAAELFEKFSGAEQLILVGDPDQLPSIGPGAVLRDVIERFPQSVQRLQTNHRAEGRALVAAAARMRVGRVPSSFPGEVTVVEVEDAAHIEQEALSHYLLLARGRKAGDVQVLAALKKTVGSLNKKLQAIQNPGGGALPGGLRTGDRVVVTGIEDRQRAMGLHNGLMGTIHPGEGERLRLIPDGSQQPVVVDLDAVALEPSYAMTVHRAQGSEWPCVLMVLDDSKFLTRNLVYTAFTRAQVRATILSTRGSLRRALAWAPLRHTSISAGLVP